MISRAIDSAIAAIAPGAAVRRAKNRKVLRMYAGAEANRLTNQSKPLNRAADAELQGPFGADAARAWARKLVRDNSWAWGVVDTIVSSVVGCGITAQSMFETDEGADLEGVNWARDAVWEEWAESCDINGQYTFVEMQRMVQREIVEAGECLVHFVETPRTEHRGISRPVPLALELIEADRIALDRDTYLTYRASGENQVIRGIELDELGKPLAYYVYPQHPSGPYSAHNLEPVRIAAKDILHLFRRDRIGQSRGVTWFAPAMSWIRDLGVYLDNEIQASAVAACFTAAIKTEGNFAGLDAGDDDTTDSNGNTFEFLEPGMVVRLDPGDSVETINPGRPNSGSEPWIKLMLRGIAVGVGLSYETVARDYSQTSYSSSRTSQLEDRRRFRCWQQYLLLHMCYPIWDRFLDAAALSGREEFPSASELLEDRRKVAPVEWQTPEWEWVDPQSEQTASQASIDHLQSTYQVELGARGRNWRQVFYQRAKEERLKRQLGLATLEQAEMANAVETAEVSTQANTPEGEQGASQAPSGEFGALSRLQWGRNQKAIEDVLGRLRAGEISQDAAGVYLQSLGMNPENAAILITDALPAESEVEQ